MTNLVERRIEDLLDRNAIDYLRPEETNDDPTNLDFYLTEYGLYIECCRFLTARKIQQCKDLDNVIVVVGVEGAERFAELIENPSL